MATITITVIDTTASVNTSHTMTISDSDAANMLAAYAARYPGAPAQTILGWCTEVFNNMLSYNRNYYADQAARAVTVISNTIT
jgi:hypothetical protein